MDNSNELARIINDASASATSIVSRTLKDLAGLRPRASVSQATVDGRPEPEGSPAVDQGRGRAVEAGGGCHGFGTSRNPQHGARRHHRAVRAAARRQRPAPGGARRRPDQSRPRSSRSCRRGSPNSSRPSASCWRAPMPPPARSTSRSSSRSTGSPRRCWAISASLPCSSTATGGRLPMPSTCSTRATRRAATALDERKTRSRRWSPRCQAAPTISTSVSSASPACSTNSLRAAEERARDVARVVAEATSEGARTIAEQHAAIRATTEDAEQAHPRSPARPLRAGVEREQGPVPAERLPKPSNCSSRRPTGLPRSCRR